MPRTFHVAMNGYQAVGKSTLLSALVGTDAPLLAEIDRRDAETQRSLRQLLSIWNELKACRLPAGTARATTYGFSFQDGHRFRFRDMKGGNSISLTQHPEDADALCDADAVLVVVECSPGGDTADQAIAAENALVAIPNDRPVALALTKAELTFTAAELVAFAQSEPARYAADRGLPQELVHLIERFDPAAVYPLSVYGYLPDTGCPAHYLDEFGRRVPYRIQPMLVHRPFEFLVDELLGTVPLVDEGDAR